MAKNIKKILMAIKEKYFKGNPKVLTPLMIGYLVSTFTRVVYRHRVDPRHSVVPLEVVDLFSDAVPLFDEDRPDSVDPARQRQQEDNSISEIISKQLMSGLVKAEDYGPDYSEFEFAENQNVNDQSSKTIPATSPHHSSE